MDDLIGSTLSHYRITARLGAGGMGEVYRATDDNLDRPVALKLLPDNVSRDPERLARFEREAKLLATLSHPNVGSIHGLEQVEGRHFLVLELVEGEDLAERIARGPIPVEDALEIAFQIADGVAAAHERGIVHRDLKPGNVMLQPDGGVKVLDFGLAKATAPGEASGSAPALSQSPTMAYQSTMAGVLLGTAGYMSPEQAKGKAVDRATDVWAFGCVLFEMLTGRPLFEGETVAETLAAVLRADPDWHALPDDAPPGIVAVLRRCLARDPRKRLHDVADARLLLEEAEVGAGHEDVAEPPSSHPARWREGLAWVMAALGLTAAGLAWLQRAAPSEETPRRVRFAFTLPDDQELALRDVPVLALAPDGSRLAYVARDPGSGQDMIHVRALDQPDPWVVPGTENARDLFFSPDGRVLGFFADNALKKVPLEGGAAVTLAPAPSPRGGVWAKDGTILYAPEYATGIWRIRDSGGTPEQVVGPETERDERTFRWPDVLPGGKAMIFTLGMADAPNDYEDARILAWSFETGERHVLIEGANVARFAPPDRLVFWRGGALYAVAFDPERLELTGDPAAVVEGVGGDASSGAGYFSVARDGTFAYVPGSATGTGAHLTLLDRAGEATRLPLDPRSFRYPRFSPDGTRLAFGMDAPGPSTNRGDVWVYALESGSLTRLTFEGQAVSPVWSRGGERIAYSDSRDTTIVVKAADGSGGEEQWMDHGVGAPIAASWSPDGRNIAFTSVAQPTNVFMAARGEEPRLFAENASVPAFSPDGRWIAYSSPSSGNSSVFVRPVEGEGLWQVSPDRGSYPRWSQNGRELLYIDIGSPDRALTSVTVEPGDTFRVGPPRIVNAESMTTFVTSTAPLLNWDVSPDGERFVFVEPDRAEGAAARIEVELNWTQQLALEPAR